MLILNFRSVSPPDPDVTAGYFRTAVMVAPQAYHAKPALSRLLGGIDDRNVWRADLLMLGERPKALVLKCGADRLSLVATETSNLDKFVGPLLADWRHLEIGARGPTVRRRRKGRNKCPVAAYGAAIS